MKGKKCAQNESFLNKNLVIGKKNYNFGALF